LLSTGEAAERDFALSERSEFAKSRQLRGAQGNPEGQVARVPFLLVRFLWASKENEQANRVVKEPAELEFTQKPRSFI
jgi:hypothetical protein